MAFAIPADDLGASGRPPARARKSAPIARRIVHNSRCQFRLAAETLYGAMTEYSGQPNRRRIDYYRNKMREPGYHGGMHFRDAGLLVIGILLVARKPA